VRKGTRIVSAKFSLYTALGRQLVRRTIDPLGYPSFAIYLLVGVIGFGGLGFWIELYRFVNASSAQASLDAARIALVTLFPALVGSCALQAVLAESERNLRAFAMLVLVLSLVMAFVVGPTSALSNPRALAIGLLAWLASVWFWVVTNAEQREFRDRIEPSAPLGGDDLNATLSGSLDDYTH
jgi:hypothetical protein